MLDTNPCFKTFLLNIIMHIQKGHEKVINKVTEGCSSLNINESEFKKFE